MVFFAQSKYGYVSLFQLFIPRFGNVTLVSAPCLPDIGVTSMRVTCVSEELSMDDDKFSCIKEVHKTVHISVPSTFISNEVSGITEILDSWKRQYVKQLQGVVVGYRNVSIASRANVFVVDQPAEHCYVTAVFYLFCPNIGTIVKGTINRISRDHIGCLIHDTVNVTVHLSDESYEDISRFMYLNSTILFQITHYDFARKFIRVEGEITPECIRLMETLYPEFVKDINKSSLKSLDNQQDLGTSNNLDFQSKKKNKKSKHMKVDAFDVLPEITSSDNHFVNFSSVKHSEVPLSKKVEHSVSSLNISTFSGTLGSNTNQLFPSSDDFLQHLKKEISDEVNSESSSQKEKMENNLSTKFSILPNVSRDDSTNKNEHKKKLKRIKKEKLSDAEAKCESPLQKEKGKTLSSSKKRKRVNNSLSDLLNEIQPDENEQPPKKKLKQSDKKNKKKKDKKDSKRDKKKSCKDKLQKEKKKLSESKSKKLKHKKEKKKDHKKSDKKSKKKKKSSKHETSNILLKTDKSEVS